MAPPKTILVMRRRRDRIFLPWTIIGFVLACGFGYDTEQIRYCFVVPAAIIGLWAYLRLTTPVGGFNDKTIEGDSGTRAMLFWLSFILICIGVFFALDSLVLNHPVNAPLVLYHWVFFVLMIAGMIGGVSSRNPHNRTDFTCHDSPRIICYLGWNSPLVEFILQRARPHWAMTS